ncbi:hypothetical protein DKX38_005707 [Salix brachista]|uniref:AAA ATPase AAA+ lid domain-containing protein n=1 Tax=Salix brachista TaxID=2182728 RepID=A0A5N5N010_9ROSI|nr:hypothetical protein DKX38_005707 [Salix brachista]
MKLMLFELRVANSYNLKMEIFTPVLGLKDIGSSTSQNRDISNVTEPEARKAMFEELMPSQPDEEKLPCDLLVERTEGFSGSDIRLLCKEAAMQPLRRIMTLLEDREEVVPEDGKFLLAYIFLNDIKKMVK